MDPPEESVVPLGTKKRPGGGIQESAYLDEFDYSFPATSSKHGLRRSGAIQENALKDSRILRPTLSSIAKSRNALRVRSYLRAEAEKRGGPRIASPGDCITGAEGDLLADAIGVHDNAKRLKSSHSSIVAPGSPDRRRAPPAEGVPSRYSRGETASGSAEQAVNCDERTLELAARDVEYLTEEIKNNPLFLHTSIRGPLLLKVVCPLTAKVLSTVEVAPARVLHCGYEAALHGYKINALAGNLLMRMFLALADKREKLSPERPSHHHDCVMIKSQVHWFLTKGYPATAASFWKVWIYHELAYGSLDEALQIYFAALERFRGRKTSGELVEYMESQLDKYARDRDAGGRPPEVAVRSLGLPQSPRTPEGAGRLERLLRRTPCGNPDRIVDSRCFTSPRKRGTYDRLCVEMHGKPLRIDAGPSTPPPLRVAAPLNFGSYTNPGKYPPSPSSKIWGYTRASSSPNIFAPSRGRLPPRDSLGSPSAEDSIADRRLQGAT